MNVFYREGLSPEW